MLIGNKTAVAKPQVESVSYRDERNPGITRPADYAAIVADAIRVLAADCIINPEMGFAKGYNPKRVRHFVQETGRPRQWSSATATHADWLRAIASRDMPTAIKWQVHEGLDGSGELVIFPSNKV